MKIILYSILIGFVISCGNPQQNNSDVNEDLVANEFQGTVDELSAVNGSTYLPIYSEVYQRDKTKKFKLTTTVSIRNTSASDTLHIFKGEYYNSKGEMIKNYINKTLFLQPMETVEIVISESDVKGGVGANFIFNWSTKSKTEPLFQALMLSTSSQQGISFLTSGVRID